jgi:predicted DNA binding CopG/RHH family protein
MKDYKLDPEEQEILNAVESGEWKPVRLTKKELEKYVQAARNTLKKDQHVHIRLSRPDLEGLKRKAVREGIPYQTLISSVLHKFVTGNIKLGIN